MRPGRGESTGGDSATSRQRILDYLASHGGSVESSDGRGLTREMARAVGYEDLSTLNAMLTRLEREGAIVREVRGRRTYRIAVASAAPQRRTKRGAAGAGDPSPDEAVGEICHPRGQLRFCLLMLLAERPGHGYDLVERLRPFGYERDDPAQTYRALHWLEAANLVDPTWETAGPGPARRVFTLTSTGHRVLERCAVIIRERIATLQEHLDRRPARRLEVVSPADRSYEVLVEAKLLVDAADEEDARNKVEEALADRRVLDSGVRATGQAWLYEATPDDDD
ncbi:MAG: helix-turn-helix transcriptional regulator [Actinomycetota bacterium]|nr:helix-turn-helix transcriptional regulator [Actinomycetota bacterium]